MGASAQFEAYGAPVIRLGEAVPDVGKIDVSLARRQMFVHSEADVLEVDLQDPIRNRGQDLSRATFARHVQMAYIYG